MFFYNIRLAWLSITKTPVLTGLIIAAIGLGVGVCITVLTVYGLMQKNPAVGYSEQTVTYKLNNQPEVTDGSQARNPFAYASYRDALALMDSDFPVEHSIHYQTAGIYHSDNLNIRPFRSELRLATRGFYSVHRVPFRYGAPWTQSDESGDPYKVVLTEDLNERLFRGENSVGERVRINEDFFTVTGVLDNFTPIPKYFEVDSGPFEEMVGAIIPFSLTPQIGLRKENGDSRCEASFTGEGGWQEFLDADCYWLHHWVALSDSSDQQAFKDHLQSYALSQRAFGRYQGEIKSEVHDVMDWLEDREVVNEDYEFLSGVAVMFLVVCLLNCIGLILTKFTGKASETSLRRAVGASKKMIFRQHIIEVGLVGILGGLLGLIISWIGLTSLRSLYDNYSFLTNLNLEMIILSVVLAIIAALLSGLFPAWRACRVPAALYLK